MVSVMPSAGLHGQGGILALDAREHAAAAGDLAEKERGRGYCIHSFVRSFIHGSTHARGRSVMGAQCTD